MNLGALADEGIQKFGEYQTCYFEGICRSLYGDSAEAILRGRGRCVI